MTEENKNQQQCMPELVQNQEQVQILLKETMKENKSLQSKNAKLESKYVELFKQHKLLKKDHAVFVSFFGRFFKEGEEEEAQRFQELGIGQYELPELEKLADRKQSALMNCVQQLQRIAEEKDRERAAQIEKRERERLLQLEQRIAQTREELTKSYEQRLREVRDAGNRQINDYLKEIESFRKSNQMQTEEIYELRSNIESKTNELSKIAKEKLKLEHHLNTIRKKEIALQLNVDKEQTSQKDSTQRNESIALRHQVQELMMKRDQLRQQLKEKTEEISKQRRRNEVLQDEIQKIRYFQMQMNQKYELVRQCSIEELYNLILTRNDPQPIKQPQQVEPQKQQVVSNPDDQDQIQREYLKNVMIRYIKAETSGSFDQSLILLQIIGNLLKLDPSLSKALQAYKNRRKQWWYIKY